MTHDEQKRAAEMAGEAVRAILEVYAETNRVPRLNEIEVMVTNTVRETMSMLSTERIAAGYYATGSGMVN